MKVGGKPKASLAQGSHDSQPKAPLYVEAIAESEAFEESAHLPRELVQTLIDAIPSVTIVIDCNHRIVFANLAARVTGGIAPASGHVSCYELFHKRSMPCEGQDVPCPLVQVQESKAPTKVTHTHLDADGNEHIVEVTAVPILDEAGNVAHVIESCQDITDRENAQKALSESEQRFELAVRAANAGIWDRDLRTNEIYYSPLWKSMLGYKEDEIGDDYNEWKDRLHPDDRENALRAMQDYLEGKSEEYKVEFRLRHRNGEYLWVLSHGMAVRDTTGSPCRVVGSHIDITDRKSAELKLRREKQLLGQLLDLREQERKLVAYEIHDALTQPLTATLMTWEAALHALRSEHPEISLEGFGDASRALRDTIDASRQVIDGLRPTTLDDFGIVSAIEMLIEDTSKNAHVHIEFVKRVKFDRLVSVLETAIFRIVQESLVNAVRHSNSSEIRVSLTQQDESVIVDIRDWGRGFVPTEIGEGHFGLEGIRERASLLGGSAGVESCPGEGTRVSVELPLSKMDE